MSLLWVIGLVWAYMTVWFIASLVVRRNDVADVAWGLGFVLLVWSAAIASNTWTFTAWLVCAAVTVWGLRLAWHVAARNIRKPEDARYRVWRETWGAWFVPRSYLQVFMLQGALMLLIALPAMAVVRAGAAVTVWTVLGMTVWCVGFAFEVIGDAQLWKFLRTPENKGHLMQQGLWRYSRHPNYFGEVMQWWGIWLVACAVSGGVFTIIGPLTITGLILFVSGVPMLERNMQQHPEFAAYRRRTSVFFPLPPRE